MTRTASRSAFGRSNPPRTSFSKASSQSALPMTMQKTDRRASVFILWAEARESRPSSSSPRFFLEDAPSLSASSSDPGSPPSLSPSSQSGGLPCWLPAQNAPPIHHRPFVSASSTSRSVTRKHDPLFFPASVRDAADLILPKHFLRAFVFSRSAASCFRGLLFFSSMMVSTMYSIREDSGAVLGWLGAAAAVVVVVVSSRCCAF
mmetsp:Transcript_2936/g.5448  ORF Transcript_2936/g.5448 Transcript_2936/m.5448 type:complete len:204 (-) Transcript_2936:290-901(-)